MKPVNELRTIKCELVGESPMLDSIADIFAIGHLKVVKKWENILPSSKGHMIRRQLELEQSPSGLQLSVLMLTSRPLAFLAVTSDLAEATGQDVKEVRNKYYHLATELCMNSSEAEVIEFMHKHTGKNPY